MSSPSSSLDTNVSNDSSTRMQDASKMSPSHYLSPPEFWFSPSLTPDTKTVTTYLKTCFHLLADLTLEVTRHAPRYKLHKAFSEANICNCYRASPGLSCHDCTTPATFRPTKFKFLYVAPNCAKISFIEMRTYLSSGLILRDIPNSITPQTTLSPFFFGCPVLDRGTSEGRYLCPWQACATTAYSESAR